MRTSFAFLALLALASVAVAGEKSSPPKAAAPAGDSFVVHEWGTFTSVSGSDGVRLEFQPLVDNDLPDFVINRAWQSGSPHLLYSKAGHRVFQRMETPVTYFYTDREREVRVKVGFPTGLLTEFYPPVVEMKPEFNWQKRAEIGKSELDWGKVTLIPTSRLRTQVANPEVAKSIEARLLAALLPESHSSNHYVFARETDSAIVHVRRPPDEKRPAAPMGDFFEKFLFYRGLGNFSLPLSVKSYGQDRYEVSNIGPDPIRSLFLVTVHDGKVRFAQHDAVPAGGRVVMQQSKQVATVDTLSGEVAKALIAERLYDREAQSMVKTWRDSWFQEEGTRLFYMLPERITDELLPLTIEPKPSEIVRVMVGRLEVMTPEDETRITGLVKASAAKRSEDARKAAELAAAKERGETVPEPAEAAPGSRLPEALLTMGRLAEPALVRVKFYSKDLAVRQEATILLQELQTHWETQTGG